ncbi:unnamed protein product [marine sediment metagenome]|uniref:Uncharacterized protein n=1 Tax=marine sediment metagenome TaxID=412755 RepID=X0S5C9_9ZZZZ
MEKQKKESNEEFGIAGVYRSKYLNGQLKTQADLDKWYVEESHKQAKILISLAQEILDETDPNMLGRTWGDINCIDADFFEMITQVDDFIPLEKISNPKLKDILNGIDFFHLEMISKNALKILESWIAEGMNRDLIRLILRESNRLCLHCARRYITAGDVKISQICTSDALKLKKEVKKSAKG